MLAKTQTKFDLISRSTILRSDKPNKGLEAIEAPNPNQMNRIVGYLSDGTKVVVAQRPGKGGMDFNKIMGGKVYAVAADALSPVYEKGEDRKPTKVQKTEDGMPLYSSSGFYLLSSKDYPALDMGEFYTKLISRGTQVLLLSEAQLAARQSMTLESELELDMLAMALTEALSDDKNLVSRFDPAINTKRRRGIERAKEECEDAGETYSGVQFTELAVNKKDGNPFVLLSWRVGNSPAQEMLVLREREKINDDGRVMGEYFNAEEAVAAFQAGKDYARLVAEIEAGNTVEVSWVQGHLMRTSVSFRRKVENVLAEPDEKTRYGDAVYIKGALKTWCKGLAMLMHSQHPNFPQADYEAHPYVAAVRQAEIGMTKKLDGSGWNPPAIPDRTGDVVRV